MKGFVGSALLLAGSATAMLFVWRDVTATRARCASVCGPTLASFTAWTLNDHHSHDGLSRIAVTFSGDPIGVWVTIITISLVMIAVLINLGNISRAIIGVTIGRRIRRAWGQRPRARTGSGPTVAEAGAVSEDRDAR
jgi:hypothetical protein